MPASFSGDSLTHDKLIAGPAELLLDRKVTIASGQVLARGAVVGKVTADGKYKLSASAAGDGSEVPDGVIVEAVDASGGDAEGLIYIRGDFAESALTLGTGHTVDSIREGLRDKGIHLIKTQGA